MSSCALSSNFNKGFPVVGNGNIDVGNKTPTRKPGAAGQRTDRQNPVKTEGLKICGAMSQQRGDSGRGNESAPQKFVQLVGCRDSKARPETAARLRPVPAKQ